MDVNSQFSIYKASCRNKDCVCVCLLGEMAHFLAGSRQVQDDPGVFHVRKQSSDQRMTKSCQKDTEANLSQTEDN